MKNSDHPSDVEIEETLADLMSACDETLAQGRDPTALLEQLHDLPPQIQIEFAETLQTLKDIQEAMSSKEGSLSVRRPFGKFILLRTLGRGSFGVVWLAEDTQLDRKIALKIPHLHRQMSPEAADRLVREARAAASLEHPHLVPIFEIGQIDGLDFLTSLYCEGPTLAEWRKAHRVASFGEAARLIEKLARGGAHMHERGVVHRDLKPGNVLLFPITPQEDSRSLDDYVPRITDFGLARRREISETLTRTGIILGTPAYMAPEQAWGRSSDVGPAADIYALGAILYELVDGQPPYRGESELDLLQQARESEPISLRRRNCKVPCDLDTICLKCLAPNPAKRYESMSALADDLANFLEGRPIAARRSGFLERMASRIRRRPFVAALTSLAVALLFALIGTALYYEIRERGNQQTIANAAKDAEERENREIRNQAYAARMREAARVHERGKFDQLKDILQPFEPKDGQEDIRGFEWHYLSSFVPKDFEKLKHEGHVMGLTYSSDGRLCASTGSDRSIHIFIPKDGILRATLKGHTVPARNLAFIAGDTELISTGMEYDKKSDEYCCELTHWDIAKERPIGSPLKFRQEGFYRVHNPFAIAREAQKVFIIKRGGRFDRVVSLDLRSGIETEVFRYKNTSHEEITLVRTTPRADVIAIVIDSETVEIYDPQSMKRIVTDRFKLGVHAGCFSDDGSTLALAHGAPPAEPDQRIDVCDARTLKIKHTLSQPNISHGLMCDPFSERLAAFTFPMNRLNIWDVKTGRTLTPPSIDWVASGPAGFVFHSLTFSPTGNHIALGCDDGIVRVRAFPDRTAQTLPGPLPKSEAWSVVFSEDGDTLWAGYDHEEGGNQETLRRWNLKNKTSQLFKEHPSMVAALALRPDGEQLASAGFDKTVRLWETASDKPPRVLQGHELPVRAVTYHPDGRRIASAGEDWVRVWNVADGSSRGWIAHEKKIRCLAYSADGKMLVTAGNDERVKTWDADTLKLIWDIKEFDHVQALACAPNGPFVATGNEKGEVNLWNLTTGKLVRSMPDNGGKVRAVAFSPDGKTLAAGGEGKTVRLRQTATGQELLTFSCDAFINGLAFDPRGKTLAAALHDGTIKIWSAD